MTDHRLLIVTPEMGWFKYYSYLLKSVGLAYDHAPTYDEAIALMKKADFDLVVCDAILPGKTGFDFLRWMGREHPKTPIVFLYESLDHTTHAEKEMLKYATHILPKKSLSDDLTVVILKTLGVNP